VSVEVFCLPTRAKRSGCLEGLPHLPLRGQRRNCTGFPFHSAGWRNPEGERL